MDFDYKKYSLENLENWMHDAMSSSEASPQEIYDVIVSVVKENYYTYKHQVSQAYELLALLNGNKQDKNNLGYSAFAGDNGAGSISHNNISYQKQPFTCDKNDPSPECKGAWNDFWEENYYPEENKMDDCMPPWGHSDMEALRYTEEELNAMCDKAASDEEKEKCREYNLREAEYYNKRAELDLNPGPQQKYVGWTEVKDSDFNEMFPGREKHKIDVKDQISRNDSTRIDYKDGLIYESPDSGKTIYARKPGESERTLIKEEKINKWVIPVEIDGPSGEYFVNLPDDLLKSANLKEDDEVEWIDNKNGSYTLRKVTKLIKMEEC